MFKELLREYLGFSYLASLDRKIEDWKQNLKVLVYYQTSNKQANFSIFLHYDWIVCAPCVVIELCFRINNRF